MKMTWYDPTPKIKGKLAANLDDAAMVIQDSAKQLISVQGPPPSRPGRPPHIDTKELYDSIDHATDTATFVAAIGSDVPQSAYTEFGTVNMDPRPWLRRTCLKNANKVARALGK